MSNKWEKTENLIKEEEEEKKQKVFAFRSECKKFNK